MISRKTRLIKINRGLIAETGIIPMGLKFISDSYSFKPIKMEKSIAEGKGGQEVTTFKITGLFQEADKENANGRIYPRGVISKAVEAVQEDVKRRAVLGEFDHPADAKIHLDNVSHLITKVWMDGAKVYGEAEVLDSQPKGLCLRGLFEQKVQPGISSRGVGDMEVKESNGEEYYEVLPGYTFVTWDVVAEPSVSGATLNVMEGLNRVLSPLQKAKPKLRKETYEKALVTEIKSYFSIK